MGEPARMKTVRAALEERPARVEKELTQKMDDK